MKNKLRELIIELQSTALDNEELIEFATTVAKLRGCDASTALRELVNADPDAIMTRYLNQRNEEQSLEAIDAARGGDYELIDRRTKLKMITPQEEEFLNQLIEGKKPPGRPPTMRTRHPTIAVTVEAFRGSGATLQRATVLAAKAWCLSEETITELYKRHKLPDEQMKFIREYFSDSTEVDVTEFIQAYRKAERA
ncbi:MAG: hypothetical protein ACREDO_05250 [Methyloceanibacter sp.]